MPKQYEAIRDSEIKRGVPEKEAKRIAAATYNKNRPKGAPPVTRNSDAQKKRNFSNKIRGKMKAAFPKD